MNPCASAAPVVNFATEWLDELGCICPKAVDYASQCPKGHVLVIFTGGGGGASALRLMCRICHSFAERGDASQAAPKKVPAKVAASKKAAVPRKAVAKPMTTKPAATKTRPTAAKWLVCSAGGCCAGYAVCDCCVRALQQAPAAAAGGDDFPSLVSRMHTSLDLGCSRCCRVLPSLTCSG